jgi:hypothetical protein
VKAGTSESLSGEAPVGLSKVFEFVNVQVTVSPALTSIAEGGLPSSQLAPTWAQVGGTLSEIE